MRSICRFTCRSTRFLARAGRAARRWSFDPLAELVVYGLAPIGGTAQDHGLLVRGGVSLTSTLMDCAPSVRASAELNFFSSDFGAPRRAS
jgi:hypothetical protein